MANKRKSKAKPKTKKKKYKLVKTSRKRTKTKKKIVTKKSATKKRSKKSRKNNKLKSIKKTRGVKMSAEAMKVSSVLDTSHLKVKFPFKSKYGNYINGKFVEPKSGKYFDNTWSFYDEVTSAIARSYLKDGDDASDAAYAIFST